MREKIARAIHKQIYGSDIMWRESVPAADAVLDALMEPTEGMYRAAFEELVPVMDAKAAWEAMIKAAREGK